MLISRCALSTSINSLGSSEIGWTCPLNIEHSFSSDTSFLKILHCWPTWLKVRKSLIGGGGCQVGWEGKEYSNKPYLSRCYKIAVIFNCGIKPLINYLNQVLLNQVFKPQRAASPEIKGRHYPLGSRTVDRYRLITPMQHPKWTLGVRYQSKLPLSFQIRYPLTVENTIKMPSLVLTLWIFWSIHLMWTSISANSWM